MAEQRTLTFTGHLRELRRRISYCLGAMITPTMDPFNQTLVAAPIVVLYFMGIALAQLARRGKKERNVVPAMAETTS